MIGKRPTSTIASEGAAAKVSAQLMTLDAPLLRLELIADVLEQSGITGSGPQEEA